MDAITSAEGSCLTSVQGSETTVDRFGFQRPRQARWGDTRPQRAVHARNARQREVILDAFHEAGPPELGKRLRRMEQCCVCPMLCLTSNGTVQVAPGYCRDRLCPTCASNRGRIVQARIEGAIRDMDQTRFLTLTLKASTAPLDEQIRHLYASFRRMRQHDAWAAHVKGGIAVLEVTENPKTAQWHPHLHVLMDGEYWQQQQIKACWQEATGDSSIVDIRAVVSRSAAARYVAAYVAKPAEVESWKSERIVEYAQALHGKRLIIAFGSMHGKLKDPDDDGARPQLVGMLCSSLRLARAKEQGCQYAVLACEMLARSGGMCQRAACVTARPALAPRDPLTAADTAVLVTALKRVGGDETAWLPEIEPKRKFSGGACGGSRPKDMTARIWEECPYTHTLIPTANVTAPTVDSPC